MFKIRAVKEGRPYQLLSTPKFLDTFIKSIFSDQNFLCELFLHEREFPMDVHQNPIPYLGDIRLRAFNSFVTNHMHWWSAIQPYRRMRILPPFGFEVSPNLLHY